METLTSYRVLLAEDEYYIADDLAQRLSAYGAIVLGPVPTLERALAIVQAEERIDGAVIYINLRGEMAFPLADALEERDVPFVFATGYNTVAIPDRYQHVPRWGKPYHLEGLVQILPVLIHRS
jgi:DNA-binding NtrC family response regulator